MIINQKKINIELAKSDADLEKGMGERDFLCRDCGMLFLFPRAGKYGFWMKGMRFNLDIIWVKDDAIVYIEKNIPYNSLKTYTPDALADKVLEINAGYSDKNNFKIGDRVEHADI